MPRVTVMRANPRTSGQRIERVYGVNGGARFAGVRFDSGQRVDVRIRGTSDGRHANAWGDAYPAEETRRPKIYEMARRQLVTDMAAKDAATRAAKSNPLHGRPQTLAEYVRAGGRVFTVHDASGAAVGYVKAYARTSAARDARNAGLRLGKQVPVSHLATIATTLMQLNPATATRVKRVRVKANPPAARVAAVLSTRAIELRYLHAEDKRTPYKHAFSTGVTVQLLSDGSVRLFRPDGKPIWKKFED